MIVTCHNCSTKLQLDPAKVPSRAFSVRCPKCQQIVNAQPPAAAAQRDALAAVGDVPASTRTQQEAVASPPPAALLREEPAGGDGKDDVLRLLAAVLRREAGTDSQATQGSGRRHTWESRRALVCVGSGQGTEAARALADEGYAVMPVVDAAQAATLLREERVDVVVLDREFDARGQGAGQVARELTSMRTSERRRVVFVMLSESARTGDAHAAFLAGANLVVHMRDAAELPRYLERNIHDLNDLYRDFNKALGLAQL